MATLILVERHGCRDVGLIQGLRCQGSATGHACNSRFATFSSPLPLNERIFSSSLHENNTTILYRFLDHSSYISPKLQQSASQYVHRQSNRLHKISLMYGSGPTPHSSDFRQGFGSQLGDYAPGLAISLVSPVGFHQSRAMEDCALTASGSKRTGLSAARVAGLGDKKIRRRHASRFLVFTSHLSSSLDLPLTFLPCIALIVS